MLFYTIEVRERCVQRPINAVDTLTKEPAEIQDAADDSFSLSSLDDILAELKRPKQQQPPPSAAKRSVQWKEPVESRKSDNSWDSTWLSWNSIRKYTSSILFVQKSILYLFQTKKLTQPEPIPKKFCCTM